MHTWPKVICGALIAFAGSISIGCEGLNQATNDDPSAVDEADLGELSQALGAINSCVCVASSCGNGGIGGANGDIDNNLSTEVVLSDYRPDLIGAAATGWACRTAGLHSCVCTLDACGNGAIGGVSGDLDTNIPIESVLTDYGPDRIGAQATGWSCLLSET